MRRSSPASRATVGRARLAPALVATLVTALVALLGAPVGNGWAHATVRAGKEPTCDAPPVTFRVRSGSTGDDGTTLRVTDAVARRVPIVPRPSGSTTGDPEKLEKLRKKAARTPLALYTLYVADFDVPRDELEGFGFGDVEAPRDKTVAAITIVPTKKRGFSEGDVAKAGSLRYDATTTFAPLGMVVSSSGERQRYAFDAVDGRVRIRELDAKAICLDVDLTFTLDDDVVASAEGVVRAPVVKPVPSFFFT